MGLSNGCEGLTLLLSERVGFQGKTRPKMAMTLLW